MPIGLVVPVAFVGWATACALTSWRRLGGAARVPALVLNELPFLAGYLLIASTILALAQGDLESVGGVIVGVVALVELLGLLVIVRRALRADAALHDPTPPAPAVASDSDGTAAGVPARRRTGSEPFVRRRPAPKPRHVLPPGPSGRRTGGAALPRRRLSFGQQAPRGPTADRASGRSGHDLRERQLPASPSRRLRRTARRRLGRDRVGAVARARTTAAIRIRSSWSAARPAPTCRSMRSTPARMGSPASSADTATTAT